MSNNFGACPQSAFVAQARTQRRVGRLPGCSRPNGDLQITDFAGAAMSNALRDLHQPKSATELLMTSTLEF
jgi:hypothetical protein